MPTLVRYVLSRRESPPQSSPHWLTKSRLVVWVLHRYGCRPAFITAGLALALGNLMQYTAVVSVKVEVLILANMLFGAGASFVLIIPTHYSDVWFSPAGRMGATAVASLAFPAGSGVSFSEKYKHLSADQLIVSVALSVCWPPCGHKDQHNLVTSRNRLNGGKLAVNKHPIIPKLPNSY